LSLMSKRKKNSSLYSLGSEPKQEEDKAGLKTVAGNCIYYYLGSFWFLFIGYDGVLNHALCYSSRRVGYGGCGHEIFFVLGLIMFLLTTIALIVACMTPKKRL
jgi:hypothetical protein